MINDLQLDVCYYIRWCHHLVNAYEIEAGVMFTGKTVIYTCCDPYLSAFAVSHDKAVIYIQITFTITFYLYVH